MIIGLDCGHKTGWALSTGQVGVFVAPMHDHGESLARWWWWFNDVLTEQKPNLVLIERAWLAGVRDGDVTLSMIRSAHALAFIHEIPRAELTANQVRTLTFGKGEYGKLPKTASKRDAARIEKARSFGWSVETDHAADAALLIEAWRLESKGKNLSKALPI